nr:WAT1-related protein At3g30340-like [Ipomoea batatas]
MKMMKCLNTWKPGAAMIAVSFAFAVANTLFKMVLNRGVNQLVLTTYRQSISAIFLAPIACCMERQERINMKCKSGKAKVLGTVICLIGTIVLTLYKGKPLTNNNASSSQGVEAHHNAKSWVIGSLFLFAGSLSWSSWFIIQGRVGSDYPYQYSSTSIMSFFGAIQSAIFCFIIDRNNSIWRLKGSLEIWTIIFSGIVGSSICYVVMSWCVKQKGPVFTSAFSPFIQIFAIVLNVSILHEQIHLGSILGSILVIVGLYTLLWGKSKEAEVCKTAPTPNKDVQTVLPVTNSPSHT